MSNPMGWKIGWELSWARHPVVPRPYRVGPVAVPWVELAEEGTYVHHVVIQTWGLWRLMLTHRESAGYEFTPWPDVVERVEFWEEPPCDHDPQRCCLKCAVHVTPHRGCFLR